MESTRSVGSVLTFGFNKISVAVLLVIFLQCASKSFFAAAERQFEPVHGIIFADSTHQTAQGETLLSSASSALDDYFATSDENSIMNKDDLEPAVNIVFSDIDGTLLHYPALLDDQLEVNHEPGNPMITLPPSSTGMVGVISTKTLFFCQELRRQGTKLVLVSGMRTWTLLKRLPYLPRADAYCCEAGGRIFYPSQTEDSDREGCLKVTPASFEGASDADLESFYISEDLDWRSRMEEITAAGKDGYVGNELSNYLGIDEKIPIHQRQGALWEYARQLTEQGFIADTEGYATCFRVNRKHQSSASLEKFVALVKSEIPRPPELSTSVNLGAVDFYPVASGKLNWYVPSTCCSALF